MRLATVIALAACAQHSPNQPNRVQTAAAIPVQAVQKAEAPPPPVVTVTTPQAKKPHIVLHIGDSMVGYGHGLSLAMKKRFQTEGVEYHWDAWTSAQVQTLDKNKMNRLLAAYKPDLVLFNLGTNNLSVPHPEALANGIHAIAERLAEDGRTCVWIAPIRPKWKYNPKVYDVLRENVAPCKYFDAGDIDPPLQSDHIHPTDTGGEQWATPLWTYLEAGLLSPG